MQAPLLDILMRSTAFRHSQALFILPLTTSPTSPQTPTHKLPKKMKAHPTPFQNLGGPLFPPATDLSPTSIFPPTPIDLFTTILPLTPPDATKSPRYVKELWDDFDFDRLDALPKVCVPPPPPPSPVPIVAKPIPALPRIGVWRSSTSSSTSKRGGSAVVQAPLPPVAQPAVSSFPLGPYLPPAPPLKKKRRRRHPRGFYRCRKCGGAKRAHDCPFACRQKSMATQTNLEITGAGSTPVASPTCH